MRCVCGIRGGMGRREGRSIHWLDQEVAAEELMAEMMGKKRSAGMASVLAVGTANPANAVEQSSFPELYFRVTNSEHLTKLKAKFKRICEAVKVKKRYLHLTEEMLKQRPNLCSWMDPSLSTRRELVVEEVPRLAAEACRKAIREWGRPAEDVTHLVFCTTLGFDLPGADLRLVKLLALPSTVKRVMMYMQGCFAGAMSLRIAKDIAENDRRARVLVVCAEMTMGWFRGPNENHLDSLVGQAVLGDGAGALIVGADPVPGEESAPLFEIVSASQRVVPDTEGGVGGHLLEGGLTFFLERDVPNIFSANIADCLREAFEPLRAGGHLPPDHDWNSIFWMVHPGGPAFLDRFEEKLSLEAGKLWASRRVLADYGNMSSASVLFIMDKMRRRAAEERLPTTGDGFEWGVVVGLGPGLTIDTVLLRSVPLPAADHD